ncbi:MAG: NAD(P)/FAD-dependent oxidoreductase [Thaumarchaeota archaeon]|jgi:NADH dehydrogenase|nr:NAD(P)/FAD-dependent oxidoreductase [Nitrososphaerota archaeon]MBT3743871.1 NAD(P)/FAD-dependent oxidoreductase [Nitrososphaerota archaeon]MBT4175639.1 NAD(P)/FAD-dependent oxidoreductase [Nitrososphaerota archaeon]MBT4510385.1 NAD(P)/FAD-dependent oxidoreductase [Nitrososphaerota archaeon]MBT4674982.1 NAD(P)/FAD-dependent oxidoreductase [Nitrososphaerota archaeon]
MKRILVLGGGFAGVECCLKLESYFGINSEIEITLVSEDNFILFTPMLPQVASGTIETRHIVTPIRTLIKKIKFYEGKIKYVDPHGKSVALYGTNENRGMLIHYDFLVVALGSKTNFFGMKNVEENSYQMSTINDAILLRNRIIDLLEQAENETDPILRKALLRIVIVGGGFAGVETAGELNDFISDVSEYYPSISENDVKVTLIEATTEILNGFPQKLANFAKEKLVERGINVILDAGVTSFDGKEVLLKSSSKSNKVLLSDSSQQKGHSRLVEINSISSRTLVWTAGVTPIDLVKESLFRTHKGRILVNEYLQVPQFPEVFAIGDCSTFDPALSMKPFPPTAQIAEAHAKIAANNLKELVCGGKMTKFDYSWKGQSAIIGKRTGIASFFGINISGFLAYLLWRNLYLSKIRSSDKKFRVWLDWTLDLFFKRDISRLKIIKKDPPRDYKELDEVDDVW